MTEEKTDKKPVFRLGPVYRDWRRLNKKFRDRQDSLIAVFKRSKRVKLIQ